MRLSETLGAVLRQRPRKLTITFTQKILFVSARSQLLWSDYRKSLPGDFIRIRLKIEQNYRLYLDIFFSAIINDLFITFISRLKVDAKCVYQQ